jgi:ABC-type branched-subunit amino acid transport system ATPase component
VISGLHQAFRGAVAFDGQDISNMPAHRISALGLVMVPEGRQVFTELSVQDNIMIGAHTRGGLSTESLESLYLMFPKLKAIRTRRAGLLSGGEQQMLAVARGLAASPRMMLLDEPSLGLAPAIVEDLFMTLARLRRDGMTLLLVDQMADMAMALSDRANLLNTGVLVFSGTPEQLRQTGHLDRAYLG